jgi:hypothetical protein
MQLLKAQARRLLKASRSKPVVQQNETQKQQQKLFGALVYPPHPLLFAAAPREL